MFDRFVKKLGEELGKELPGLEAQLKMAPPFRNNADPRTLPGYDPKVSCVLVLFYPHQEKIYTVLILRTSYGGVHSGQIAFPGGKIEEDDTSFEHTALREAKEEIGIDVEKVKVIGRLTELYIPPSNYLVHPVVAYADERPEFILDKTEVEKIIEVTTEDLIEEKFIGWKKVKTSGSELLVDVPVVEVYGEIIWGATAMMISELKEILKKCV